MDTADKLGQLADDQGYDLVVMGVPKTIDNDLACTDHCPGYGTVARYNAISIMEAGLDTAALYTHDTVTVHEVMGRNAGWIAAATSLARREPHDAPHIILMPEVPFRQDAFCRKVEQVLSRGAGCFVACGEGIRTPEGRYLAEAGGEFGTDAFGHAQLGGAAEAVRAIIETHVGVKARTQSTGTCQRTSMHCASATDAEEAYLVGKVAVEHAINGVTGKMVTLERCDGPTYDAVTGLADLADVANGEKILPKEYISEDGFDVTEAFDAYARPLIAGQAPIDVDSAGMPVYARFVKHMVEKRTGRQYNAG
jgi:6-phosphofructokinase 1